jgi:hypothetical protein
MIRSITADGPYVKIVSDEDGEKWISRRDALERARGIAGLSPIAPMLAESLIMAYAEAFKNEHGHEPSSVNFQLLKKSIMDEHARA